METGLTCRGRSCHYLRAGRKPETLMEKSITLTTLTSAPAGSTPETGRMRDPLTSLQVTTSRSRLWREGWRETLQRSAGPLPEVLPLKNPACSKGLQCVAMEMDMCHCWSVNGWMLRQKSVRRQENLLCFSILTENCKILTDAAAIQVRHSDAVATDKLFFFFSHLLSLRVLLITW